MRSPAGTRMPAVRDQDERKSHDGDDYQRNQTGCHAPVYDPRSFALPQIVKADVDNSGDDFETCVDAPVLTLAHIGGDRLLALVQEPTIGPDGEPRRRRKTFRVLGMTIDLQRWVRR